MNLWCIRKKEIRPQIEYKRKVTANPTTGSKYTLTSVEFEFWYRKKAQKFTENQFVQCFKFCLVQIHQIISYRSFAPVVWLNHYNLFDWNLFIVLYDIAKSIDSVYYFKIAWNYFCFFFNTLTLHFSLMLEKLLERANRFFFFK